MGEKPEVASPLISQPKHTAADVSYRELESSTAARASAAADMLGVPVSEMADMKITNMGSSLRQGDMAVPLVAPDNPVAKAMEAQPNSMGFNAALNPETVAQIQSARANAGYGAKAADNVRDFHQKYASQIVASGTTGRH